MFLKHGAKNVNGIELVAPTGFEPVFGHQGAHDHVVNGGRVLEYNKVSMVLRKLKS